MRGYSETGKLKNEAIVVSRPSGFQAQLRIAGTGSWFGEERAHWLAAESDLSDLLLKHTPKLVSADGISPATKAAMEDALAALA